MADVVDINEQSQIPGFTVLWAYFIEKKWRTQAIKALQGRVVLMTPMTETILSVTVSAEREAEVRTCLESFAQSVRVASPRENLLFFKIEGLT